MKLRRILTSGLLVLLGMAALLFANRLVVMQYTLGWMTDIRHPRGPNRPVPWMAGPAAAERALPQRPPNIILILADDMGYNDVSTHGGGYAAHGAGTPHIDSIARDGVNFDRGYAGAAVCTVSRAALMTGRYPWRFGVEFTPFPGAMARVAPLLYDDPTRLRQVTVDQDKAAGSKPLNELGMPGSEITIAELLTARGYHTVHIGKWHLGGTPQQPQMRPNAQGFAESLYMDRSVGRVLQALREQGLDDNTIVIFTSDNGAPGYIGLPEVNRPFRGWKLTQFEGGLRVPYMARWPGQIPAGSRYPAPMSNIDILPTIAAVAGAAVPTDRVVDGVNLLPFLAANAPPQPPRPLFWRDGPYRAVQEDGWKLIVSERPPKTWLFDLNRDPTEKTNLAQQQPDRAARLQALLVSHHAAMPPPLWPSFLQLPVAIDKTLDQKETAQDEYTYWFN